ncbi:hepatitis A virus cellular receptor 1 homolog isoform X2 [Hyla sarda]|uniref:hepatitis A virus cellular receptor 1 homolog isoform X2 n=1 Tax=Hyla sarda TaxID=327740 RepID=UPI0024C29480|nr:hepatitis A virus cellular receptor 1 homolog isoform X2 [Hyla sarda]
MSKTMIHQVFLIVGLSSLLHPAFSGSEEVQSFSGIVKIPCRYKVHTYPYEMCWGRGPCPSLSCKDGIIWTDGSKVTWRKSDKYRLMGDMKKGDVTLTIIGATVEDAGTYCCRVQIPGLFNDQKTEIDVDKKHVEDDDDINDPRIALVYVPKESALAHPTHKDVTSQIIPTEDPFSSTQPETLPSTEQSPTGETPMSPPELNTRTEEFLGITMKSHVSTMIRVTAIFSLTFLPLFIYSCIIKVNKKNKP